ncbi:MAG: DNA repair exonuclease [Desulfobacteraceae bacterium]|nr:DNA repair exonuclease [Desulfobacteraceae bacterium]MBC2757141.1 DNA repair exonuclease [Desulfobacteraceae bacterium]
MFKFIHAADIHLDSPLHKLDVYEGAPVDQIRQATRAAFENLVRLAIDQQVSFVLLSGDLYDGDWKDYNTGLYFVSQMRRLRDAQIPVLIIAGNHDAASKITKNLKLPKGVTIFSSNTPETVQLSHMGVAVHGQSFASPSIKKDLSADYPPAQPGCFNIGMLHTCATGKEGHAPYAPCSPDGLKSKGYDYWALGHVHKRETLNKDPVIIFPGNIQGRHIRETGAKGCLLVTVPENGKPKTEFIPLDVIRWFGLPVDASGADSGYEVIERFKTGLDDLINLNPGMPLVVRVILSGDTVAHKDLVFSMERWKNEIRATAADISQENVWVEKIKIHTRLPVSKTALETADGPIRELTAVFDEFRDHPESLSLLAAEELSALEAKLPPELIEGDDPLLISDPEWLSALLEQVKPMLMQRLMQKGVSE